MCCADELDAAGGGGGSTLSGAWLQHSHTDQRSWERWCHATRRSNNYSYSGRPLEAIREGERVHGVVRAVASNGIFIDVGAVRHGFLPAATAQAAQRWFVKDDFVTDLAVGHVDAVEFRLGLFLVRYPNGRPITEFRKGDRICGSVREVNCAGVCVDIGADCDGFIVAAETYRLRRTLQAGSQLDIVVGSFDSSMECIIVHLVGHRGDGHWTEGSWDKWTASHRSWWEQSSSWYQTDVCWRKAVNRVTSSAAVVSACSSGSNHGNTGSARDSSGCTWTWRGSWPTGDCPGRSQSQPARPLDGWRHATPQPCRLPCDGRDSLRQRRWLTPQPQRQHKPQEVTPNQAANTTLSRRSSPHPRCQRIRGTAGSESPSGRKSPSGRRDGRASYSPSLGPRPWRSVATAVAASGDACGDFLEPRRPTAPLRPRCRSVSEAELAVPNSSGCGAWSMQPQSTSPTRQPGVLSESKS